MGFPFKGRKHWRSSERPSLRYRALRICLCFVVCLAFALTNIGTTGAAETMYPLAPPDVSSPRETLNTFLLEMNRAVARFKAGHRDEAINHSRRALRCLNLSKEPPAIRDVIGFYAALYLKETLDRIEIPPLEDIPDAQAVATHKLSHWTLPHTEITIGAVDEGSGLTRFLFAPNTVSHSEAFYDKVKHLPYKPGEVGVIQDLSSSGGFFITRDFIKRLPRWARLEILGEHVWQWIGLALYFFIGGGSILLAHRHGCQALGLLDRRFGSDLAHSLGGLILPVTLILFAQIGLWFVVYGLHFVHSNVYFPIAIVFLLISYAGTIWLIGAVLNRTAGLVIRLVGFEEGGMRAQLTRFGFDVLTVVIVVVTAISLGARLGLPTYSLVTGLGIGGLAVALAGREALSNLIGTIIILLEQPFKLGDFIVLGEGDRGTVTEIGLRSTRIRTRDGVLVSIPNSTVANMKIINESAPVTQARIHIPIGVAYGSPVGQVEQALLLATKQCEYVVDDPPPSVRLVGFGDSALELELLVWIVRPEYKWRATSQLNRAINQEFRNRGIEIPFPQRDVHVRTSTHAKDED